METPKLRQLLTEVPDAVTPIARQVSLESSVNHLRVIGLVLLATQVAATIAVYRVVKRSAQR